MAVSCGVAQMLCVRNCALTMILRYAFGLLQDFCYDGGDGYCRTSFFDQTEACCPTSRASFPPGTRR